METSPTAPITLAGRTAPSRVIFGPHETNLGDQRRFSPRHVAYYRRRAAGGAGLIVTETASVHALDHPYERAPLAPDCAQGWAEIVRACRPHGALVLAGLGHRGLQGTGAWTRRPTFGPSRVPNPATRELPAEMTDADIHAVIDGFRLSAALAVEAGADGVELDAGPTALLRQFLSGLTNHRADAYGTDRLLLLRAVVDAVRSELGSGRILALRLCCDEDAPWAGLTPDVAARHAADLAPHLDLLTVVRGGLYAPERYRPDGHIPPGFNTALCRTVRDAVAGTVPVVAQGSIVDPAHARDLLADGTCDAVEMTRAQIADPDLVRHLRAGTAPRPCVLCNQACLVHDVRNPTVGCIGNAEAGHEHEPPVVPTPSPREVLVVGGGPAGLEAARVLAERGHRVHLRERAGELGGAVTTTAALPGRQRFALLAEWMERRCRAAGADVRTGASVDPVELGALHARGATIVTAVGARPRPPAFPAAPGHHTTATDALTDPPPPDRSVLVWDPLGDAAGVGVAEHLAARGHRVQYATPDPIAGARLAPTGDLVAANARLERAGIVRHLRVAVRAVDTAGVHLEDPITGEYTVVPDVLLVDCSPGLPGDNRAGVVPNGVGDCVAPRTVREAVREGYRLAAAL